MCAGGFVTMESWRTLRTFSSEGMGTRNGASELKAFQSFAVVFTIGMPDYHRQISSLERAAHAPVTFPSLAEWVLGFEFLAYSQRLEKAHKLHIPLPQPPAAEYPGHRPQREEGTEGELLTEADAADDRGDDREK